MQMRKKGGAAAYNGREVPQARWVGCLGVQAVRGFLHVCTCAKWGHGAVRSGWAGGEGRMVTGGWGANLCAAKADGWTQFMQQPRTAGCHIGSAARGMGWGDRRSGR